MGTKNELDMSAGARDFAMKLIRMRARLMRTGKSQRNEAAMHNAIKQLKSWLDFYPHTTDAQVARYLQRNAGALTAIMPGVRCATYTSLNKQLQTILNDKAKN